jgi:hypothetical protein
MATSQSSSPGSLDVTAGKQLFVDFLQDHLGIEFQGFQSAYGTGDDLLLFAGPRGSTLAVPTSIMHEPREAARRIVQEKIAASEQAFQNRSENDSDDELAECCRRWWQATSRTARAVRESTIGQAIANRGAA